MAAALDDPEAYSRDDAARDENRRIYTALSGLRRAGVAARAPEGAEGGAGVQQRTWGTLCTAFVDQQDARMHAALRPLLHYTAASPAALAGTVRAALGRIGVVPGAHGEHGDVFDVLGAVQGDGARQVQLFYTPEGTGVDEYLLLS